MNIQGTWAVLAGGAALLLGASSLTAEEKSLAQFTVVDSEGARMVMKDESGAIISQPGLTPRAGTIFTYHDPISIAASVSLGSPDILWVGQELNSERVQLFGLFDGGLPVWDWSYQAGNPFLVAVAAAEETDFALALNDPGGIMTVQGFDTSSWEPHWTYAFDANFQFPGRNSIDVSRDGSTAVAVASDYVNLASRLVVLNQANGAELARYDFPFTVSAVQLSADGSRAVLTAGATARVIQIADGVELASGSTGGTGGTHKISADGKVFAVGGFWIYIFREVDGVWQQAYFNFETPSWYGAAVALSEDGHYAMVASYNYINYTTLTYRIIDVFTGTEIARTTSSGGGVLQDTLVAAAVNDNGTLFATASWGLAFNEHPEVQLFDRNANVIGGIDTPGSVFGLDIRSDGSIVACGSKSIHANINGNGGDVTVYEADVPPPPCEGDANDDGVVDPLDSGYVLSRFACPVGSGDDACDAADVNHDGVVDPLDAGYVLSRFGECG